jgi:hypothetical protein
MGDQVIEYFECVKLKARLSRAGCENNRKRAKNLMVAHNGQGVYLGALSHCLECQPPGTTSGAFDANEVASMDGFVPGRRGYTFGRPNAVPKNPKKVPTGAQSVPAGPKIGPDLTKEEEAMPLSAAESQRLSEIQEETTKRLLETTPEGEIIYAPKCKKHLDRPALVNTLGFSTGKCRECMDLSVRTASRKAAAKYREPLAHLFEGKEKLYEMLKDHAKKEERSVEQQMVFIVKKFFSFKG